MPEATTFPDALADSTQFTVVPLEFETVQQVRTRFREWDDNDATLTDFTVGVRMEERGLDHVMTFDSDLDLFDVRTHPPLERR